MAVSVKVVVIQILAGTRPGRFVSTNEFFQNVEQWNNELQIDIKMQG